MLTVRDADSLMGVALRSRPRIVVFDTRQHLPDAVLEALRRVKSDSYTGVVPALVITRQRSGVVRRGLPRRRGRKSCATRATRREVAIRLAAMLRRSDRDLYVHPSTRLPGAVEMKAEIGRRLARNVLFATCYADLDHFKEFNDRYSYYEGDRVIRILAQILHDVVKGMCHEDGFVGHIGGDDFIYIIPLGGVN